MDPEETEQFDLYEGLENFEDSSPEEPEGPKEGSDDRGEASAEDEEDDFTLVVDDDDQGAKPEAPEQRPARRSTKPSIYSRKDRIFFVGAPAPGEVSDAPMSNIEFFVLVKNLPAWLDNAGLRSYVEAVTPGVVHAKVLFNLYCGAPLGVGFVEFSGISQCSTFLNHKSQIGSVPMPLDVFRQLEACAGYRQGVLSESFVKAVCRHFSVPYSAAGFSSLAQRDLIEIEFERQQEELSKRGEYELVARTFPWFNFDLVSIMGGCGRLVGEADGAHASTHLQSLSRSLGPGMDSFRKNMALLSPHVLRNLPKANPNVDKLIDRKSPPKSKPPDSRSSKKSDLRPSKKHSKDPDELRSKKRDKSPDRKDRSDPSKDRRPKKRDRSRSRSRDRDRDKRRKSPDKGSHRKPDHKRR